MVAVEASADGAAKHCPTIAARIHTECTPPSGARSTCGNQAIVPLQTDRLRGVKFDRCRGVFVHDAWHVADRPVAPRLLGTSHTHLLTVRRSNGAERVRST
jgi:hypothetical protein